ncbi:hypothetical protein H8S51_011085 [Roseburia rectibacter]|jgi:hypothetical protein|uniref:hypothetical protein n=1 Tax=Roseburia rectibacter TaxID=2763062 RepID=UPI00164A6C07|nr:hypothetical protein [Roseburia rectibacter]UMY98860.1 hypothetical protein H8S51_011085 [Roseburia rectibacter]
MGSTRPTTAKNLQKAIKNHLVTVVNAQTECKDTDEVQTITAEQFVTDLDFYMESGIFSDSLDFKYKITGKEFLQIQVGYMSSFCQHCITATLKLCDGIMMEQVEKQLRETIFDILSA